ncbi:MAG TPA: AraC family transcriptional regulator ligand-binding domain-containing protein [Xanthobacteraceae bacterium]|jgi:hypothetical protein
MQPQIRCAALQGYREICASLGLEPIALMQAAGLDPTCLNDPDRRVSAESLFRLFERSAQIGNAPDFGLRLAAARPFSIIGAALRRPQQARPRRVAEALGCSELSAFSRWYKKRFGIYPSAARQSARAGGQLLTTEQAAAPPIDA